MSQPDPAPSDDKSSNASRKDDEKHAPAAETQAARRPLLTRYIPAWVVRNVQSRKSWRLLFKSWLATWAAFILLLPNASLRVMGNAGFFSLLVAFMIPPYLPIQLYLVISSTLMVGLLLGWAIGCAGMRAALASRNQTVLKETLQKAAESVAGASNPDQVFKIEIFEGQFLDASSSVVFAVFLGFGTFIFALIRAYAPAFMFLSIYGTISLDIICTIGPLFPFAQYTLSNTVIISSAMYFAISLTVVVLVFPETLNHAYLNVVNVLLGYAGGILAMQEDVLTFQGEGTWDEDCPRRENLRALRAAMVGTYQRLTLLSKFLNAEFSFGRWNGEDVKALEVPLTALVSRISGLISFIKYAGRYTTSAASPYETAAPSGSATSTALPAPESKPASVFTRRTQASSDAPNSGLSTDSYLLQHIMHINAEAEREHGLRLTDVLPTLRSATKDLRDASIAGVAAARAHLDFINHTRWTWPWHTQPAPPTAALDAALERLRGALADFKAHGRAALAAPYADLLDAARTPAAQAHLPLRGLYVCYVFGTALVGTAEVVLALLERIQATAAAHPRNRLWAPKGVRVLLGLLARKNGGVSEGEMFGEAPAEEEEEDDVFWMETDRAPYRRDPDSEPPSNVVQKFFNGMCKLYMWCRTAKAIFCFRYVILSILLYLPAVFRSSAHFYYANKGVWALIMAQTILNIYAGDQLWNYVTRIVGTFVGLVYGIMIWYIGSGSGHGSPYGLAASFAVFSVPVVFVRLFAPPQYLQGVVLGTATIALVLGYSWIDGHLPVISGPGFGWVVAWKRWTLVMIGCGAAFVLMMLPPQSGRRAVRLRNAKTIDGVSHVYAALMSAWIAEPGAPSMLEADKEKLHGHAALETRWAREFRARLIGIVGKLQGLRTLVDLARWEGGVRGHWNHRDYVRMVDIQIEMVSCLASLGSALWRLDSGWRQKFLHQTKVVNPNFIMDVMSIFSLVSQSLRNGEPIHTVLPRHLLDRLFYHHTPVSLKQDADLRGVIDKEDMQSIEYMYYSAAVIAVFQLAGCLDELHAITRRLCGEVPFQGFERWRDEHERVHAHL